MLSQLRRKWSKLLRLRQTNRELPVLRWQVERLEDRSMLSASFGPVPYGHGPGPMQGPHGASDLHSMPPGAYAPPPSYRDVAGFQPMRGEHGSQPTFGSFGPQSRMQDDLAARPMMPAYEPQQSPYLSPYTPISPPAVEKLASAPPTIKTQTRSTSTNPSNLSFSPGSLPPGTWNVFLVSPNSS